MAVFKRDGESHVPLQQWNKNATKENLEKTNYIYEFVYLIMRAWGQGTKHEFEPHLICKVLERPYISGCPYPRSRVILFDEIN